MNTFKTTSFTSFFWTILLIILLACFTVVMTIGNQKANLISSNINVLKQDSANYHKLDTCISILYDAENNSRLFVLTLDSAYIKKYQQQLASVSELLYQYENQQNKQSTQLSKLIKKKGITNQEFVYLKVMLDSLLFYTLQHQPEKSMMLQKQSVVAGNLTQTIQQDSLLIATKKSKKRLLKRIADAIANDESADSITSLSKSTIVSRDSVVVPLIAKNQQHGLYNEFNSARRKLDQREKQLLMINGRIFLNLQSTLKELKYLKEQEREAVRRSLLTDTESSINEARVLYFGSVGMVIILTLIIIWNLVRLYKKELTILNYAALTEETTSRKGVFMAQVAHEIRTPLNSVIGFSELIDTQNMDEDLKVNVNAIKSSSKILLTLVNEILDFSKFESGMITLQNKRIFPMDLLNEAMSILSVLASEKNIVITPAFNLDPKIGLLGDEFRIKQIVINLLTNAVKFTPTGGHISLSSDFIKSNNEGGIFSINVKDSGVGIAPENQQKIFEDFTQIEMVDTSSRHLGTGLGLAICKKITDLYDGEISVKSVLGHGSEFIVAIPLQIASPTATINTEANKAASQASLKGRKVLIVEDSKINLVLISRIMDKYGMTYDLAGNGKEAYQLFETKQYDLIITDIQMPEMGGIELTELIRQYPDTQKSNIPVLGFTGSSSAENRVKLIGIGMNDVLGKPFEEQDLFNILISLLRK